MATMLLEASSSNAMAQESCEQCSHSSVEKKHLKRLPSLSRHTDLERPGCRFAYQH